MSKSSILLTNITFILNLLTVVSVIALICLCNSSATGDIRLSGKKYVLVEERLSFLDAATNCESKNGRLAKIERQEDNDYIQNTILKRLDKDVWIGGRNKEGTTTYEWLHGSRLKYSNWIDLYRGVSNGKCFGIHMRPNGQWSVLKCDYKEYSLCVMKVNSDDDNGDNGDNDGSTNDKSTENTSELNQKVAENSKRIDKLEDSVHLDIKQLKAQVEDLSTDLEFYKKQNQYLEERMKRMERNFF